MSQQPSDQRKALSAAERVSVVRLANAGERHPDDRVREAATLWAHDPSWNRWWNRVPGWLLPALGVAVIVAIVVASLPLLLVIPGALVVVFGLLGWNSTAAVTTVRAANPPLDGK